MSKAFQPNWVSPPGSTINNILGEKQIPISAFANEMSLTVIQANNLIKGSAAITPAIAEKLSVFLGSTHNFWLRRESQYRDTIKSLWLSALPIKDMTKFGWISSQEDRLAECLNFFGTPDIESWRRKYKKELNTINFRTSASFDNHPAAVAAWIRMGEIKAESINCGSWSPAGFRKALDSIRPLTKQKDPQIFLPKLEEICAEHGVAVAVVRTPSGCSASGATKFLNPNKALLLLSFRYLSDDQFWFTFFHEVGHLLLHEKESLFIEEKHNDPWDNREKEANEFSANFLIPEQDRYELSRIPLTQRGIIKFSLKLGISPGIVIGQMQFYGRLKPNQLNSYKRRYNWEDLEAVD